MKAIQTFQEMHRLVADGKKLFKIVAALFEYQPLYLLSPASLIHHEITT